MPAWLHVVSIALGALGGGGGLAAVLAAGAHRRKTDADAAASIADAAVELLAPLRVRVAELTAEVDTLRSAVQRLTLDVVARDQQIAELRRHLPAQCPYAQDATGLPKGSA